jgi:hypothetical protein
MESATTYRDIIKKVILKYAELRPSHGDIRLDPLFDETHDGYALVQVGWDRGRRVRGLLLYLTIREGKVVVEYDGMEISISEDLIRGGIPEESVVLAYLAEVSV